MHPELHYISEVMDCRNVAEYLNSHTAEGYQLQVCEALPPSQQVIVVMAKVTMPPDEEEPEHRGFQTGG